MQDGLSISFIFFYLLVRVSQCSFIGVKKKNYQQTDIITQYILHLLIFYRNLEELNLLLFVNNNSCAVFNVFFEMYPSNFLQCSCTWKWCTVEFWGHYGIEKLWCYLKSPKSDKWRNEKLEINQFWNFNKYYWLCHMRWLAYWTYSPFQKCSPFLQIFWSVFLANNP